MGRQALSSDNLGKKRGHEKVSKVTQTCYNISVFLRIARLGFCVSLFHGE
jgi:hypothetical protein